MDGRLRGFILSRLAADEAEILTIAVEAASQGKGVGRALLSENLRQASNAGARTIFLEVDKDNAPALALYGRLGFVKVGERAGYYRRSDGMGAPALIMRKALFIRPGPYRRRRAGAPTLTLGRGSKGRRPNTSAPDIRPIG